MDHWTESITRHAVVVAHASRALIKFKAPPTNTPFYHRVRKFADDLRALAAAYPLYASMLGEAADAAERENLAGYGGA